MNINGQRRVVTEKNATLNRLKTNATERSTALDEEATTSEAFTKSTDADYLNQTANTHYRHNLAQNTIVQLQRIIGNRATVGLLNKAKTLQSFEKKPTETITPNLNHAGVITRKAKVTDFASRWQRGPLVDDNNPATMGRNANLSIQILADFQKDDQYNPADAEYKQFVKDKWEVTAPAHRARVISEIPNWQDDGYSRSDDVDGHDRNSTEFKTRDFPGLHHSADRQDGLLSTDVLAATFSAKQQIIDISDNDAVIAEIPEHTATITGIHPRTYTGLGEFEGDMDL